MNRAEVLYQDFSVRLQPRMIWHSQERGTLWLHRERPQKVKHRPTEAEDNAIGRALRRKQNRCNRGWIPYAKR